MTRRVPAKRILSCGCLCLIAGTWLFLFAPVMFGVEQFGYRDSASLYQPLFEWTASQWASGSIPLWCPHDSWGVPVVGDATSSVFYPGKLIFLMSFLSFPVRFGLFVAFHVLLAAASTMWCARTMGCSMPAQTLAAISYASGGYVLFQTCNVVFLVGAAWLPLAIGITWQLRSTRQLHWALRLAVVTALMVLGGDPQMAYHVTLIVGVLLVASVGRNDKHWKISGVLAAIGCTVGLGLTLSAIQVLPAVEWARESERMIATDSRTVLDSLARLPDNGWRPEPLIHDLIRRPQPGTHGDATYQFSLPPWTIAELIWPNVLGKLDFTTNDRWANHLPGADRVWTGSIYLGVAVTLLTIAHLFSRRRHDLDKFLIVLAIFFGLGSFGWYGLGWFVHELQLMRGGAGTGHWIGEPTGGVYWFMEILLPWYSGFRYPAKLFVVASLAICLLGGRGLDRLTADNQSETGDSDLRFTNRLLKLTWAVFFLTWAAWLLTRLVTIADAWPPSNWSTREMSDAIGSALLHTGITTAGLLICINFMRWSVISRLQMACWIAGITAIELVIAVSWTLATIPADEQEDGAAALANAHAIFRSHAVDLYTPPPRNLVEQQRLDRASLKPKYHLPARVRQVSSFHSVEPLDLLLFRQTLNALTGSERYNVLRGMSVDEVLEPRNHLAEQDSPVLAVPLHAAARIRFAVGDLDASTVDETSYDEVMRATIQVQQMLAQKPFEWAHVACDPAVLNAVDARPLNSNESIAVEFESAMSMSAVVTSEYRRLVVIADYFDESWEATIQPAGGAKQNAPIYRVNRILRGVFVPPGTSILAMQYRPRSIYYGAVASCLAWLALILWTLRPGRFR